jgi:putative flavoprotein involved in K+ transport
MNASATPLKTRLTLEKHVPVVVIGAGQAGLSLSYCLKQAGVEHVVLEKHRVGHAWRHERWDTFCLVTPNWQCRLPGFSYTGADPHGFMLRDEIVAFLESYANFVAPPLRENVSVERVTRSGHGYIVQTSAGTYTADAVIVAISGYHTPILPKAAQGLPSSIAQIHSQEYRNPAQLPGGSILVVGSGQSGCQIAEDLHRAGRAVHLAIGDAPRSPRLYRGRDVTDWLDESGHYDMPIHEHPRGYDVRANENHYMTGRDGGREIDLRRFALEGMRLYGRLDSVDGGVARFEPNLTKHLDNADDVYCRIRRTIDAPVEPDYVPVWSPPQDPLALDLARENVTSVVWSTGYRTDFGFIEVPAFDARGYPHHERGVSSVEGLYFIGLPWLYTWGSGRFRGVARDAQHIASHVAAYVPAGRQPEVALRA